MELNRVLYIDDLPISLNNELLLTRLSFKKRKTELNSDIISEVHKISDMALRLSNPRGAFTFLHLNNRKNNLLYIDDFKIYNDYLNDRMSGSCAAVLMAATIGNTIDDKIDELLSEGEYTRAVVLDAAASLIADSAVDGLKEYMDNLLSEEGLKTGNFRISPGQVGLETDLQKTIYDKLSLGKIGVFINEKMMLTPQKSVISITGIFEQKNNT